MPKIKMDVTTQGSNDGRKVNHYLAGQEYEVCEGLAKNFVDDQGIATRVKIERKAMTAAPENASMKKAPKNKDADKEKISVMRVYELAKKLDVPSKQIIQAAANLDISATAPASGLSESEIELITAELE